MSDLLTDYKSFLIVGIGAAPGAISRMQILKKFYSYRKSYLPGILTVNTLATFFLSYILSLENQLLLNSKSQSLYLLLCVGFLGSFSTFSSLVLELYNYSLDKRWKDLFLMIFFSISLGLIASSIGSELANG